MHSRDAVEALARDMNAHFGTRLQSFVAYGLTIHDESGRDSAVDASHHGHAPAAHTLAVVDRVSPDDLRALASRVDDWHERGLATPLLLGAHEFERSLDAFPY